MDFLPNQRLLDMRNTLYEQFRMAANSNAVEGAAEVHMARLQAVGLIASAIVGVEGELRNRGCQYNEVGR